MSLFGRKRTPSRHEPSPEELQLLARVLANYPPGTTLHFGAPLRCPECAAFAMVVDVDRVHGFSTNFCLTCQIEWRLSAAALRRAPVATPMPRVAPVGALFTPTDDRAVAAHESSLALPIHDDLHLVLVEDDPVDAELVQTLLRPPVTGIEISHAATRREGQELARQPGVDLVMLDLGLPDSSGLSTLSSWREAELPSPIIVVSGESSPELLVGARQQGAAEFVRKQELVPLLDRGAAGTATMVDFLRFVVEAERRPTRFDARPFGQSLLAAPG